MPRAFSKQNVCVCMCKGMHLYNVQKRGSLHKRAPVGSLKDFSPNTKCVSFYSHCCRANKMSSVSMTDFIDQWKGIIVCGKSLDSGAKLALNPDSLTLYLHELGQVT